MKSGDVFYNKVKNEVFLIRSVAKLYSKGYAVVVEDSQGLLFITVDTLKLSKKLVERICRI